MIREMTLTDYEEMFDLWKRGWEKKDFWSFYSKSIADKENIPLFDTK